MIGIVGDPEEGYYIMIVEQVEDLDTHGDVVEEPPQLRLAYTLEAVKLYRVAPVHSEIGWQAILDGAIGLVGMSDRGTRTIYQAQAHAPKGYLGHIVL